MQLRQAQRQLLSRCTLRYYSAGAVSGNSASDVVAAAGTSVSPRLKRPLASSFGGISIQNVVVPSQSVSQGPRNRTSRPSRPDGPNNKSPGTRRTGQHQRYEGVDKSGALSGWDDGLVSLNFSSRLQQRQKRMAAQSTRPDAQSWKQHSKPAKRPQMHGHRDGEKKQAGGSQAPRRTSAEKPATATQENREERRPAKAEARNTSMTRPSTSSFKIHAQSQSNPATPAAATRKITPDAAATQTSATTTTDAPADRTAQLTALSSTNLNALFRTRDTAIAGIPLPAHTSTTPRVRSVLERSAGDYSRFLPRHVGVRKNISALRTARHALAVQRDVSLDQRRVALHIIDGLAQPRRQARA